MEQKLANKVAIVTGGGAGIGEAICKKFALHGARVVVCGLPDDPVAEVVNEIKAQGGKAIAFTGDISLAANAQACVQRAIDTYGKLDILINNAGVFPAVGYIQEYPNEGFEQLVKNNIGSVYMMTKYAMPHLQQSKGCLVCAGSEAGLEGDAQNAPYAGTKGFIHAFTRGVAAEQAQYGVRANVVAPGPIDTAWMHKETSPMTAKMEKLFVTATPMGRRGTPEEVANVYLFLASEDASYVTGAIYSVDGGIAISKGPMGLMADKSMKKEPEGQLDLRHSQSGDSLRHVTNPTGTRDGESLYTSKRVLVGASLALLAAGALVGVLGKGWPFRKNTTGEGDGAAMNLANGSLNTPSDGQETMEEDTVLIDASDAGTVIVDASHANMVLVGTDVADNMDEGEEATARDTRERPATGGSAGNFTPVASIPLDASIYPAGTTEDDAMNRMKPPPDPGKNLQP